MLDLHGSLSAVAGLNGSVAVGYDSHLKYEGAYTFTPSEEVQTIRIADRVAVMDITIEPVPNTYARVAYDGSVLTFY